MHACAYMCTRTHAQAGFSEVAKVCIKKGAAKDPEALPMQKLATLCSLSLKHQISWENNMRISPKTHEHF